MHAQCFFDHDPNRYNNACVHRSENIIIEGPINESGSLRESKYEGIKNAKLHAPRYLTRAENFYVIVSLFRAFPKVSPQNLEAGVISLYHRTMLLRGNDGNSD